LKPHKRNYLDRFGRPIFVDKTRFSTEESMVKNAVVDSIPYHVSHQSQMLRSDKAITVKVKQQILVTIDYLRSKNIEIIFFTPPYYKAYTDNYPKEYVDLTKKIMMHIVAEKNVNYFDFSKHLNITDDYRYFYDSHHLNADGSKIFSQALFAKLNH
jgi:16S rRNA G966 N2-methylase RsmD